MLVKFSSLPHGFELLKGNIHDQNERVDNSELTVLVANETTIDFDFYPNSHHGVHC